MLELIFGYYINISTITYMENMSPRSENPSCIVNFIGNSWIHIKGKTCKQVNDKVETKLEIRRING